MSTLQLILLFVAFTACTTFLFAWLHGLIKVTTVRMDADNRMLRAGLGKNEGRWFARIDLWSIGFRVTKA